MYLTFVYTSVRHGWLHGIYAYVKLHRRHPHASGLAFLHLNICVHITFVNVNHPKGHISSSFIKHVCALKRFCLFTFIHAYLDINVGKHRLMLEGIKGHRSYLKRENITFSQKQRENRIICHKICAYICLLHYYARDEAVRTWVSFNDSCVFS